MLRKTRPACGVPLNAVSMTCWISGAVSARTGSSPPGLFDHTKVARILVAHALREIVLILVGVLERGDQRAPRLLVAGKQHLAGLVGLVDRGPECGDAGRRGQVTPTVDGVGEEPLPGGVGLLGDQARQLRNALGELLGQRLAFWEADARPGSRGALEFLEIEIAGSDRVHDPPHVLRQLHGAAPGSAGLLRQ